jgi:hypothetical protein
LKFFIAEVEKELVKPLIEGDYDGLVKMMGILIRVKERQQATDEMFEPLRQTIELLKLYNQEMPEEVVQQLLVCMRQILMEFLDRGDANSFRRWNTPSENLEQISL